jgi:putative oxygen-independent coproporphyrinogen III oxidase
MHTSKEPFSLYIHIPYCISKCPYCDFNSHVVAEIPERAYTDSLIQELDHYSKQDDWRSRTIQSIFFGGGTPSTFQPASIGKILERVAARWNLLADCEITLEANPGTVDGANFFGYRACGVNRISVGIQSFQPRLLKFLGRVHSAEEAKTALHVVREACFENFSLDLIYANPGQTLTDLEADLETALSFRSPHLSVYNLTIEEGTPFHHEFRSGRIQLLNEEEEIAMAELIEQRLANAGLHRYEISNYARPGLHSRHNANYWRGGDYLGLGAGAHSYQRTDSNEVPGRRWSNEKNPGRYIACISEAGSAVTDSEDIDRAKAAGELMFLGLRMTEGVSTEVFRKRLGRSPVEFYPQIATWREGQLIEETGGFLRLTNKGLLVANSIFVEFM